MNGLENKVQMDLQQRAHAHKNNITNEYLVLVKDSRVVGDLFSL